MNICTQCSTSSMCVLIYIGNRAYTLAVQLFPMLIHRCVHTVSADCKSIHRCVHSDSADGKSIHLRQNTVAADVSLHRCVHTVSADGKSIHRRQHTVSADVKYIHRCVHTVSADGKYIHRCVHTVSTEGKSIHRHQHTVSADGKSSPWGARQSSFTAAVSEPVQEILHVICIETRWLSLPRWLGESLDTCRVIHRTVQMTLTEEPVGTPSVTSPFMHGPVSFMNYQCRIINASIMIHTTLGIRTTKNSIIIDNVNFFPVYFQINCVLPLLHACRSQRKMSNEFCRYCMHAVHNAKWDSFSTSFAVIACLPFTTQNDQYEFCRYCMHAVHNTKWVIIVLKL